MVFFFLFCLLLYTYYVMQIICKSDLYQHAWMQTMMSVTPQRGTVYTTTVTAASNLTFRICTTDYNLHLWMMEFTYMYKVTQWLNNQQRRGEM